MITGLRLDTYKSSITSTSTGINSSLQLLAGLLVTPILKIRLDWQINILVNN